MLDSLMRRKIGCFFYQILNFRGQVEQDFSSFANCLDIFDGFQSEARQNFEKPEMMPPTKQFGKKWRKASGQFKNQDYNFFSGSDSMATHEWFTLEVIWANKGRRHHIGGALLLLMEAITEAN